MDPIFTEFKADLERVDRLVWLVKGLRTAKGVSLPEDALPRVPFVEYAEALHAGATSAHTDLLILSGTLLMYLGGRFEYFVRAEFEDLCQRIADKKASYANLPAKMRQSIITMTGTVIQNPRKYNHGDGAVETFVKVLAANFHDGTKPAGINAPCLSITTENMRFDTVRELFERVGATNFWERIGHQAVIQLYFDSADQGKTTSEIKGKLNEFMDLRNKIAHPSSTVNYPDPTKVEEYLGFFQALGEAISIVVPVFANT
jgi:hypothetical protein